MWGVQKWGDGLEDWPWLRQEVVRPEPGGVSEPEKIAEVGALDSAVDWKECVQSGSRVFYLEG